MKKIASSIFLKLIIVTLFITLISTIFQFNNIYEKFNDIEEDVFLTFYNGDIQLNKMPKKDNEDNLGFDYAECNNGASVEWDYKKWAPIVTNLTKSKTKCNLYFAPNLINNYIYEVAEKSSSELAYDNTSDKNLRYIGSSPRNYIDIGDRDSSNKPILWQIIGIMNNMIIINKDGTISNGKSLIKIIRADSIGKWSWDSSANEVNYGYGVNEWSEADIMTTLNTGAYWNRESGQCYNGSSDKQATCDFSSTGLTESVKEKIVKVRWNTGTVETISYPSSPIPKYMYEGERSNHHGKEQCASSGGNHCNDNVPRTTTWDGYIGLMYLSDYGYAVGGDVRVKCLNYDMINWDGSNLDCKGNNWLFTGANQWTITPFSLSSYANEAFYIYSGGDFDSTFAYYAYNIRPTVYLNSDIKIQEKSDSNYGSQSNPFVIEGVS